jgi:hypothetical protein
VPFLPLIGGVYMFYYPLHVVLGESSVNYLFRLDPAFDYDRAVQLALIGWGSLLVGYYLATGMRIGTPFRGVRPTDLLTLKSWGKLLVWGGLLIDAARQVVPIPVVLRGLLHFTSMFSLLGIALLTILAVQRRLTRRERWLLYAAILFTAILRAGSGLVSNVVILAITVFLAVWAGGGRLGVRWLLIAAVSVAALIGMRSVAMEYRARAWFAETQLSMVGRASLMGQLLYSKVDAQGVASTAMDGRSSRVDQPTWTFWRTSFGKPGQLFRSGEVRRISHSSGSRCPGSSGRPSRRRRWGRTSVTGTATSIPGIRGRRSTCRFSSSSTRTLVSSAS